MYESHFGITRSPFQLTPDPWFYFDSRGHDQALTALRQGCTPGKAFVVVSGEVGSGKSMLVRTMLDELGGRVVVGYIASTQLNGEELRRAVGAAFGIPLIEQSLSTWEASFADLLGSLQEDDKRAVLIIDEAQHLDRDGLLMLEALTPSPTWCRAPLEVWLIGQPGLRDLLAAPELRTFRERIGISCYLGPFDGHETQAYIEHRLHKVGWTDRPHFEVDAFDAIFRCTSGLPRQINRLCNRLLLASFLTSATIIDALAVTRAARDLQEEVQGLDDSLTTDAQVSSAVSARVVQSAAAQVEMSEPAEPHEGAASKAQLLTERLLLVVGGHSDHIKAAALMHALSSSVNPIDCTLVRVHRNDALRLHGALFEGLHGIHDCIELDVTANVQAVQTADITNRFERLLQERAPCAVVVFDGSELALACAVVASKHLVPCANVGAGVRLLHGTRTADLSRTLADRLASQLYTADEIATEHLLTAGVPADRVHCVGSLVADSLAMGLRTCASAAPVESTSLRDERLSDRRGYGVVALNQPANVERRERLSNLVQVLRQARRDLPLVWVMARRTTQRIQDFGLSSMLASERITCVPLQPYPSFVQLIKDATCVFSDSPVVNDEALILGVPCLAFFDQADRDNSAGARAAVAVGTDAKLATRALWGILYGGAPLASVPALWDAGAGARIALHLSAWIQERRKSLPATGEPLTAALP